MKVDATISMSYRNGEGVNIRINDNASGIEFVDLLLDNEQFALFLSSLQYRPAVKCEVRGLEHLGKERENDTVVMYYDGLLPNQWTNVEAARAVLIAEAEKQGLVNAEDAGPDWILSAYPAINRQHGRGQDEKGKWYKIARTRYVPIKGE